MVKKACRVRLSTYCLNGRKKTVFLRIEIPSITLPYIPPYTLQRLSRCHFWRELNRWVPAS